MEERHNILELCSKLYASLVKNRLRDIESSSDNEQSRWIWELMQNAKDCSDESICLLPDSNKKPSTKPVKIRITYTNDEVVFEHNGFPFNNNTLDSLMYRYSSKGENDSTGRFGTGFMTSHTLSKITYIEAPFIDDKGIIKHVKATVFREGKTKKELRIEFFKMEESKRINDFDPNNEDQKWTKFIYRLENSTSKKSLNLGIQSFKDNIFKTFLFCPEIESIEINNESTYKCNLLSSTIYEDKFFPEKIQIEFKELISKEEKHNFIVFTVTEKNNEFADKYDKDHEIENSDKKLNFSIALEINSNNQLINNEQNKIRLYCTFPLIGSEDFRLPFLLNSPYFEILTERNGLLLDGEIYNTDNSLTNRGLNEIILSRSICLFKVILNWLVSNDYSNFSLFAKDIDNSFVFKKELDKILINEQNIPISDIFRDIMAESFIIKDCNACPKKLNDVFFLNFDDIKNRESFHSFASKFYNNVASYDDCISWKDLLWPKLNILSIEDFVEHISLIGQKKSFRYPEEKLKRSALLQNTDSLTKDDIDFLNQFYSFLLKEEPFNANNYSSKIWIYPIVLNSKSSLSLFSNLKSSEKLSEELKEIMSLCKTWGNKLIHHQINSFSSIIQAATFNDAQKELNQYLSENQNDDDLLLSLIKYIPNGNSNQIEIYKLVQKFLGNEKAIPSEKYVNNINESLWGKVNDYLLRIIQQKISNYYNHTINENELVDYNKFYDMYQKHCRNSDFLVPNLYLVLKRKEELKSISNNIQQDVIYAFKPFISLDYYMHPSITFVKCNQEYNLDQFISDINSLLDSNKNVLSAILSILPPSENQRLYTLQEKICNLAQFFLNTKISFIKSNITDELFWKKANESVFEQIKSLMQSSNNIETLSNKLHKNKDQIFDNLNNYYSLIIQIGGSDWRSDTLMPNHYGKLVPVKSLSIVDNVPDDYLNFYNGLKNESDIRESFAHPSIRCDFLEIIDFPKFVDMICQNISDKQLINDMNVQQRIVNLNPFNSLKLANNKLINKLYSVNIGNVLNDINSPTENDKTRWVWELIQIAKDSISNSHDKIDINFEINYNPGNNQCKEIIFSHNGPAFTEKSLYQLIFALNPNRNSVSNKKYGKGLASTHVLSKKIKITGNILQNKIISGFSLVLNREGNNDDNILKDFKKIQKSIQIVKEPYKMTSFLYETKNQISRESVEKGLKHIENHIYQVLINCPEIQTINIKSKKKETAYSIPNPDQRRISNKKYFIYNISKNNQIFHHIVLNDENSKIKISIVVNDNWEIISNDNDVKLFYTFPIVGSQLHKLPFTLSSSKLIPTSLCDGLLLKNKTENEEEKASLEINRSILKKSLSLYEQLIVILNNQNCPNTEEMTQGFSLSTNPYDSFDMDWYDQNIKTRMQEILLNNIRITTFSNSVIALKNAIFASDRVVDEKLNKFINFADKCQYNNIANKECHDKWRNRLKDSIRTITIEELINAAKNNKSLLEDPSLEFFNDFLGFIWNLDTNLLYNNKIIPDMNNQFHNIPRENEDDDFRISKNVPDNIIEMMEFISIPWKSTHMNTSIHSLRFLEDKINDAQNRIIEKTKSNPNLCYDIMKYVLTDNSFRKDMFSIVVDLQKRNFENYIEINNIDPSVWSFADSYVINEIAKELTRFDQNSVKNHLSYFKKFILVFIKYNRNDQKIIYSTKIIPNAKCHLKSLDELYNRINSSNNSFDIHNYLNNIFIENNLGIDFDERIIHPEIYDDDEIKSKKNETVFDLIYEINACFGKKNINEETKIKVAKSIVSLIPENLNNSKIRSSQNEFFELCNNFFILDKRIIKDKFYDEYKWEPSNKFVISYICNEISQLKSFDAFLNKIQNYNLFMDNPNNAQKNDVNIDQCFDLLNSVYKFADQFGVLDNYEILPCLNGSFKKRYCIKQNPGIDDELLKCIKSLDPESTIQEKIVDYRVKVVGLGEINFLQFYQDMNKMFMKSIDDVDAREMLYKINKVDDSSFFDRITTHLMTKDEECKFNILIEAHVNFLRDYLRENDMQSESAMKRWPFELIQNANDTVQFAKRKVKISFDFQDNKLIFSHDGEPFQNNNLLGLLYQCSYGKNNKKTTGKFGTGFLSTLIVSREIHLSGDLASNTLRDKNNIGFDVHIVRKGSTPDELKKGIREMENSFKKGRPKKGITTFEYIYPNDRDYNHKKVIQTGLQSLKENVPIVLVLNPTIDSITITENKQMTTYKLENNQNVANNVVSSQTVSIISNSSISNEKFFDVYCTERVDTSILHQIIDESNKEKKDKYFQIYNESNEYMYTNIEKYFNNFDVHINCLIRVDDKTNGIALISGSNFFSSYPIFGISQINSPFIINSPDFELERERQYLLLSVDETKHGKMESLINKYIIKKSAELYELIIQKAVNEKCNDLYNLFRNLGDNITSRNHNYVNQHFTYIIQSFVEKYPLFNTGSGLKMIENVVIPYDRSYDDEKNKKFYDLFSRFKSENFDFTIFEDCPKWVRIAWSGFPSIYTISQFIQFISNKRSINSFHIGSEIEFMKKFYDFIFLVYENNYDSIFNNNYLLINQFGDLKRFEDIKQISLPDVVYKILDAIGYNYKSLILHPEINYLSDKLHFIQFDISQVVGVCVNNINENNSVNLMQFVIESDSNRELMYKYTKLLLNPNLEKTILPNDDIAQKLKDIFPKPDNFVCKKFITALFNMSFDDLANIDFHEFIELLKSHLSSSEYSNANLSKLLFQKCLSDAEKKLRKSNKYINIERVCKDDIRLDLFLTERKCNFRANDINGNDIYYFIVKQSEYFSFGSYSTSKNTSDLNEHFTLMIIFNVESKKPNFMILEEI